MRADGDGGERVDVPGGGVIVASPATAPETPPTTVLWPSVNRSSTSQTSMPAAAARWVLINAWAASPLAWSPSPPLKPNQPNQRMPAPRMVSGIELRRRGGRRPAPAPADDQQQCRARRLPRGVHDHAAGPVLGAELGQPAVGVPEPVRDRRVDDDGPDREEQHPAGEPQPARGGAGDQRRGDHREHHLVRDERQRRDGHLAGDDVQVGRGRHAEIAQPEQFEIAEEAVPASSPKAMV